MPESTTSSPESIVQSWLTDIVDTASTRDHAGHMSLISKKIKLVGVPGFESIGFDDWSNQCKHEFETGLIKDIQYQGIKIKENNGARIMFITHETIIANDGTQKQQAIECLLENEENVWRLTEQRIMNEVESALFLSTL